MFDVFTTKLAHDIFLRTYSMNQAETWSDCVDRVVNTVITDPSVRSDMRRVIFDRKFIPAGRYLYSSGRSFHNVNNCYAFRAEDSREGWADLVHKASAALLCGGGIGVDYSAIRPEGAHISRTGGKATGPISLMKIMNSIGENVMQGGQRRSAIWAGLQWDHADIFKFIALKSVDGVLSSTNVSVIYNTEFFEAYEDAKHLKHVLAHHVWNTHARAAFEKAEPGWSFNFGKDNESLRNACTELTTEDDGDKCNLGTPFMSRCDNLEDFMETCRLSTIFLLFGALYTDYPLDSMREVGTKNNRIGVGLGGIAEWLMARNMQYKMNPELATWAQCWKDTVDNTADEWSARLGVARPKGTRAIAPNGTIGILSETTTGIEPLFASAYIRRYFSEGVWKNQYVVDGAAKRLLEKGIKRNAIFDAYDLGFEQRVKFQADMQEYTDHAISSTCNMAAWGTPENCEETVPMHAAILMKYAKRLRGFTVYPDGARFGQPITKIDLEYALKKEGMEFEDRMHECTNGVCGL